MGAKIEAERSFFDELSVKAHETQFVEWFPTINGDGAEQAYSLTKRGLPDVSHSIGDLRQNQSSEVRRPIDGRDRYTPELCYDLASDRTNGRTWP